MKKRLFVGLCLVLLFVLMALSCFASTQTIVLPNTGTLSYTAIIEGQLRYNCADPWMASGFITVPSHCAGLNYSLPTTALYRQVSFFDSSKTYIGYYQFPVNSGFVSIPAGASYMRLTTFNNEGTYSFSVEDPVNYVVYYKDFSNENIIFPTMIGSEYDRQVISLTAPAITGYTAYIATYDLTLSSGTNEYTFYYQADSGGGSGGESGGTTVNVDLSGISAQLGTIIEKLDSFFGFTVREFLQKPIDSFTVTEGLLLLVVLILIIRLIFSIFNR